MGLFNRNYKPNQQEEEVVQYLRKDSDRQKRTKTYTGQFNIL